MSLLQRITPLILTFNEEENIGRVLKRLTWAEEVVVVDSGSTDKTPEICNGFENVRIFERAFDGHASQWNFGLRNTGIQSEWILALDADYVLTEGLIDEISALTPSAGIAGYRMNFRYCVYGKPLSGSLYPPVVALYRRDKAHYIQDGHTQRVVVEGDVEDLGNYAFHDDRKPLGRWLASQDRYAELECELLRKKKWNELRWQDRLRKMIFVTPWLVPLYCLVGRKGLFDGWRGVFYATQRSIAEAILSLRLIDAYFDKSSGGDD